MSDPCASKQADGRGSALHTNRPDRDGPWARIAAPHQRAAKEHRPVRDYGWLRPQLDYGLVSRGWLGARGTRHGSGRDTGTDGDGDEDEGADENADENADGDRTRMGMIDRLSHAGPVVGGTPAIYLAGMLCVRVHYL